MILEIHEHYWNISDALCAATGFMSPRELIQKVTSWPGRFHSIETLMQEDKTFEFSKVNLPVRVFLARFISFQIDKEKTPEFFCWPGLWMSTARTDGISPQVALALFEEHRALFLDKEDGDVYPRTFLNRDEKAVQETFDSFYAWVATYELTRQWIVNSGEFKYDFSWLTSKHSNKEMESWASEHFKSSFGISIEDFNIVKR